MMKLFLVLAAAALVFIAAADASRYTVTTSIVEESSSNPRSDCRQQIQRQEFRGCERYMTDGNRKDLNRCCQELDRLPDRCEREALRDIMRHQQKHAEGREEMMQRAREIESSCRVGSTEVEESEEEEESNPRSDCRQQIERREFRGCERYMSDGNRKDLNRCCQELDRLPNRCEKEALRDIMRQQQQHTEGREEMMQRAREIESTCRVGSTEVEESEEEEESNPRSDCRQQIERREFRGCERYMSEGNRKDLNRCCQELDRLPNRCEREALRDIMRQQQQHAEGREEMMKREREIESTCRVGSSSSSLAEAEIEESNPSGSCREQVQMQDLRGCERFMRSGDRSRDLNRCCREMERIDDRCQREAMREIMRHQGGGGYGMREMEERAREVMRSCGRGGGYYGSLIRMIMGN